MKLYIEAETLDALAHTLLYELDGIARRHRGGITFQIGNDAPHLSVEEMARIMELSPGLKAIDLWRRSPAVVSDD
jgi:hypothetical protein